MRFDLTDLSLFRHVVEAGSITHGAERAHLALAAASTRIRNMEEALGAPLLVRGRHGVATTQAGRTLLQHARIMLAQAERLREDLGSYAGGLAGQVRVLSNTNALTEFLPETLSSFLAAHPNVSVDLEERLSRRDRRPDRRGRRRHRHRGGHRRYQPADHLSVPHRPLRAGGGAGPSVRQPLQGRFRRGAGPRVRRARTLQRGAALLRRQGQPARPYAAAAGATAQLRHGVPAGRARRRRRHRAGDHGAARGQGDGDQGDRSHRPLGAARAHHLHPRFRRACRPSRGSWSSTCAPVRINAASGGRNRFPFRVGYLAWRGSARELDHAYFEAFPDGGGRCRSGGRVFDAGFRRNGQRRAQGQERQGRRRRRSDARCPTACCSSCRSRG